MTMPPSAPDRETMALPFVPALMMFRTVRRAVLPALFASVILAAADAHALDPRQRIDQLYHSTWNEKDGITGAVTALAQTTDGYLWLGTTDGLLRFNGISFERYKPDSGSLLANSIGTLMS